jgi:hypothetical protein
MVRLEPHLPVNAHPQPDTALAQSIPQRQKCRRGADARLESPAWLLNVAGRWVEWGSRPGRVSSRLGRPGDDHVVSAEPDGGEPTQKVVPKGGDDQRCWRAICRREAHGWC